MTSLAVIAYAVGLPAYVLVKALTPNFFARGDTRTPVKYSMVVFAANLIFSLLLMKPFGHVGIASATTVAAFVSLYQYVRGLKKRGFWTFGPELVKKIVKITVSSLIMGIVLIGGEFALNRLYGNWLALGYALKIPFFVGLCVLGVATFGIAAKLTGALNISDIMCMISKKRKNNVQA